MQSVEKKIAKAIARYGVDIFYNDDNTFTPYKGIVVLQGKSQSETDTVYGKATAANYRLFATEEQLLWIKRGARFTCDLGFFIVRDFVEVYFQKELVCLKATVENLSWGEKYDN